MKKYIILLLILLLPFNVLAYSDKIIPGGDTLGIEVKNKGVIIVGFYRVKSKLNKNNLEYILCTRDERLMLDGCVFTFKGKYYSVIDSNNEIKQIFKGTKLMIYQNITNQNIYVKYYSKFYNTKLINDRISRSEKIKITKIENQKILQQVLNERDKKQKARI